MRFLLILLLAVTIASCNRPECKTTNAAFVNHSPEDAPYKAELSKQLKLVNRDKLTYWIDKYTEKDSRQYMSIYIQGDGLCAKGVFDITEGRGLEQYKKVKGMSYSGAELKGFKYRVDDTGNELHYVYEEADRISD